MSLKTVMHYTLLNAAVQAGRAFLSDDMNEAKEAILSQYPEEERDSPYPRRRVHLAQKRVKSRHNHLDVAQRSINMYQERMSQEAKDTVQFVTENMLIAADKIISIEQVKMRRFLTLINEQFIDSFLKNIDEMAEQKKEEVSNAEGV